MSTKTAHRIFTTWIFASLMAACGGSGPPAECPPNVHPAFCTARPGDGGGGGPVNDPAASAGLWEGSTSSGRQTFGAVLSDGTYWFFYTLIGDFSRIAGLAQGTATSAGGTLTSTNGLDFSLEGMGATTANILGTFVPQTSLSGTIRYPDESVSFTTSFTTLPSATLSQIAGNYRGEAAVVSAPTAESLSVTVNASGVIGGTTANGCNFAGTATPRTDVAAVFDITLTFSSRVCALGITTVRGIAIYDTNTGQLLSAAVNPGRTDGFLALVTKQ
ncbi:hypothetical protein [Caenimonas soli]|uniref:hypothetical protein n=1 Tax=Caenimonas soli TaxID=2735555 RepID=UPI00155692B8|nr:hypothetical protein [Caenimonas soli]NPC54317.1 hypothetical protein [Caenimonas soli]